MGTADFYNEKNLINEIINNLPIIKAGKIYLDPKIFYKISKPKNNILLAKYNKNMYKDLAVAIVKPGFSTLENCLRNGVTPISFFKNLNSEFHHNSRIIKKNKLGYVSNSINKSFELAKKICSNKMNRKKCI